MTRPRGEAGRIVAIGEIVVEIMAETRGQGFREPLALRGPFPSGAPAIFADQVGRLGHPAGLISCVGDDDFGRATVDRLRRDGVDTRAVRVDHDRVTGSAFVRYRQDGERDFIFNIRDSASGSIRIEETARSLLSECSHLHVVGSSLFCAASIEAAETAVSVVRDAGGTVSFDPNVRREMLAPAMRSALGRMLRSCDLFLPSGPELTALTSAATEREAIDEILGVGVEAIVVKRGASGADYHDREQSVAVDAFRAVEVDPTGAGDCFGATFVVCRSRGLGVRESLRYASASGARAVGRQGPMEGASSLEELEALIAATDGDGR